MVNFKKNKKTNISNSIVSVKKPELSFCFTIFSATKKESISISLNLMTEIRKV